MGRWRGGARVAPVGSDNDNESNDNKMLVQSPHLHLADDVVIFDVHQPVQQGTVIRSPPVL